MKKSLALVFALLLCGSQTANAQVSENSTLFKDIMDLDSQIFEQGFNQCKPGVFEKYTANDLEFFHDTGGTQNRAEFLQAVKKNICSNPNGKPIRSLVPGSSQVFPLENNGVLYGAVQMGIHRFDTKGADITKEGYTLAKFTHVWLIRDGQWQLKTSISYDHQHKDVKTADNFSIRKALAQPVKLLEVTIASLSFGVYFRQ
ncbi:MAG: nuclear transport factor 2 family protein [Arenimonas sp.]